MSYRKRKTKREEEVERRVVCRRNDKVYGCRRDNRERENTGMWGGKMWDNFARWGRYKT